MTEAVAENRLYYAAAFSRKMETYENIPSSEVRKLVQGLLEELLKGKIRSLHVWESSRGGE